MEQYDVVIIGAGIAGLSLARQLLLNSDKKILFLEKRAQVPPAHQKVGESCVQVSGYYFSKVLDLEEHLLREHFMKYNLRFYWKTAGRENRGFEDYGQAYIRSLSNIPTYQLNRNKIEAELLRLNLEDESFRFCPGINDLDVSLSDDGPHTVRFSFKGEQVCARAVWVVDTSGRGKFLARRMSLCEQNPIRHGTAFLWVEGLVNFEKLTDLSPREIRLNRDRSCTGHLPFWLATNHFCGEGFWFWVIPLQGITSLGLVYDNTIFDRERVKTPQKLIEWVCQEFPLFARDLPQRKILDHSAIKDFSYDCAQTISASRWALSGEAGRFTDPLYSPGGDLISLYNTMITDAILTPGDDELAVKVKLYEQLMEAVYEAYVPTYAVSYDALGDQEAFSLKYTWELTVYFACYVFPFINDLFTNRQFILLFLARFAQLGPINRSLQAFISAYYCWKRDTQQPVRHPVFNDFTELTPLRTAESTFYRVGVSVEEARGILDEQLRNLRELARYIAAHIYSVVLADERVLTNRSLIESLRLDQLQFDPERMRQHYGAHEDAAQKYAWSFDTSVFSKFRTEPYQVVLPDHLADETAMLAD
jgi:2-polyprenyl-6-methoxyphenol hydroxylase-like FAD-dependent oxidoreductase